MIGDLVGGLAQLLGGPDRIAVSRPGLGGSASTATLRCSVPFLQASASALRGVLWMLRTVFGGPIEPAHDRRRDGSEISSP
ncbi:MAG: hypothetical protein M5U14_21005 [Acidimicrobiia bacterium]|nr:hypothetical protein [Acidimicrobiia bacterium]